jgi:REP element-mobilizing transposase RayT
VERSDTHQAAKGERGIWQRRYREHIIRDESDFVRHIHCMHINPAKHRSRHASPGLAAFLIPNYGDSALN